MNDYPAKTFNSTYTRLNVLRCFIGLMLFICFLTWLFRRIYQPLIRRCVAFYWVFVGVCAQTIYYFMCSPDSLLGVFNVNAYAKVGVSMGIRRIHSHWNDWKVKRAIVFSSCCWLCCSLFWLFYGFQSLLCCETGNCVITHFACTRIQIFPIFT